MNFSRTTILSIIFGIIILAVIGYFLFGRSDVTPAVSGSATGNNDAETTFVSLTAELNPVSFDTSILTDIRFKNLVDIHEAVTPEASGRKDPFAPLGAH